jgi:disulfide bond formation protein DsbB
MLLYLIMHISARNLNVHACAEKKTDKICSDKENKMLHKHLMQQTHPLLLIHCLIMLTFVFFNKTKKFKTTAFEQKNKIKHIVRHYLPS